MANDILKYTSKDYKSISSDLIDAIPALTDTWTSREDGDPGIVLIKEMSAIGDMLSYNLDKQVLEFYGPTVTQRKNAAKLFELIGYNMHWYRSAMTTVTMTYTPRGFGYMDVLRRASLADDSSIDDIYYEYRLNYSDDYYISVGDHSGCVQIPPVSSLPEWLSEFSYIDVSGEGKWCGTPREAAEHQKDFEQIKNTDAFKNNARTFRDYSKDIYVACCNDSSNLLNLHTYIEDSQKQLDIHPDDYSGLSYSIIPSISSRYVDDSGNYLPTIRLKPFEPTQVKAIQGNLKSITLSATQLQNNKYYLPESELDEENIFVSYKTDATNRLQNSSIFLQRTDNLLTETYISESSKEIDGYESSNGLYVYFQFRVDDFDYPYIELSSYWNTVIPETAQFTIYYFKTSGKYGNITKNFLKRYGQYGSTTLSIENFDTNTSQYDNNGYLLSYCGKNPETAREGYINSLNYVTTFNSLVTIFDFERFTTRLEGMTNSLAVDKQRMIDLNKKIYYECKSYDIDKLKSILGKVNDDDTVETLIKKLYEIRKVVQIDPNNINPTVFPSDIQSESSIDFTDSEFKSYTLNMYPVYGSFRVTDDAGNSVAEFITQRDSDSRSLPYTLYGLLVDRDADASKVWTYIDREYADVHIASVEPKPTYARVFDWYCCGIIHLTKSVSMADAENILSNVKRHLADVFSARNVKFGIKITQMEVIQAVMEADPRIRYFDAGIGDKKVIVYNAQLGESASDFFNIDAYFNPESIMRYVQNTDSSNNLLIIDSSYIQTSSNYIQG